MVTILLVIFVVIAAFVILGLLGWGVQLLGAIGSFLGSSVKCVDACREGRIVLE